MENLEVKVQFHPGVKDLKTSEEILIITKDAFQKLNLQKEFKNHNALIQDI